MHFFKALIPGALLTWIGASVIGHGGARGGILNIETIQMQGHAFQWSWPLFLVATALAWIIFWSLD